MAPEPAMSTLTHRRAAFLRRMRTAVLATNRAGAPQMTPNWYLWDGENFLISTPAWTVKVRNIRRDERVSLCIADDESGDYVTVYGVATVVELPDAREPTLELLRKYREEQDVLPHWERINRDGDRVVILIKPERLAWRYD